MKQTKKYLVLISKNENNSNITQSKVKPIERVYQATSIFNVRKMIKTEFHIKKHLFIAGIYGNRFTLHTLNNEYNIDVVRY